MKIDWASLAAEHAGLAAMGEELRQAVAGDGPDFEVLARARWHLGYLLAIHLAKEDKHVYPLLKAHPNEQIASLAVAYEDEMGDLNQQYRDYLAAWQVQSILSRWAEFAAVTKALIEKLEKHILREENELYPLV